MNEIERGLGVLLINMGGPSSLDQVQPYLYELFSDPDIIQLPLGFIIQKPFAKIISSRRAEQSKARYAAIGGKSPLVEETRKQALGLEKILGVSVGFSMRYLGPRAGEVVKNLAGRGVSKLIVIPLFPQYSIATSGSAIADFKAQNTYLPYVLVNYHYDCEGYIRALAERFAEAAGAMDSSLKTHLLFAAHSLPEKYSRRGDPYVEQTKKTVELLYAGLKTNLSYSLGFQSRLGPVKWHGPSLDEELSRARTSGVEQLIVQPVSFVSENLETRYDLDMEFREKSLAAGIKNFIRVQCPDDSEIYLNALAALAQRAALENKWEDRSA